MMTSPVIWPITIGDSNVVIYARYEFAPSIPSESDDTTKSSRPRDVGNTIKPGSSVVATEFFTLTYESNGGSSIPNQQGISGSEITEPSPPNKMGYTFEGWYYDAELTAPVTWPITLNTNTTVYASWSTVEAIAMPGVINQGNGDDVSTTLPSQDSNGYQSINYTILTTMVTIAVIIFSALLTFLFFILKNRKRRQNNYG